MFADHLTITVQITFHGYMGKIKSNVSMFLRSPGASEQARSCGTGSPSEAHVLPYFVEDSSHSSPSYADFMASLLKGVLAKS